MRDKNGEHIETLYVPEGTRMRPSEETTFSWRVRLAHCQLEAVTSIRTRNGSAQDVLLTVNQADSASCSTHASRWS